MITMYIGPMFASKTTELLTKLERASIAKRRVVMLRPGVDNRGFLSHGGRKINGFKEVFTEDLLTFDISNFDVIGIDEGQFHKNLKEFIIKANKLNKDVYISALHATSESEMFEEIIRAIPYCENIIKLNAICTKCGSELGNYTFFKEGKKTEKVVVGGSNSYTALCQHCYFEEMEL